MVPHPALFLTLSLFHPARITDWAFRETIYETTVEWDLILYRDQEAFCNIHVSDHFRRPDILMAPLIDIVARPSARRAMRAAIRAFNNGC
jgi:hypothetical protein